MALTFPKSVRLTQNSEFRRVKAEGRSYTGRLITLGVLRLTDAETKFGIIVTRRIGGAVARNRVRRRIRELLRTTKPQWASGVWCVIVARRGAPGASFEELRNEWLRLAAKARVCITPKTEPSTPSEG